MTSFNPVPEVVLLSRGYCITLTEKIKIIQLVKNQTQKNVKQIYDMFHFDKSDVYNLLKRKAEILQKLQDSMFYLHYSYRIFSFVKNFLNRLGKKLNCAFSNLTFIFALLWIYLV